MRNPLKSQPSADPQPTLRKRFAAMKAKAAGLTPEPSQGRRAVLAGSLAAAVPLPVLAASAPVGAREAEFLALAADLLPLMRRLGTAQAEWRLRSEAADIEAGPFPGWRDEAVGSAWLARLTASRDFQRCSEAWDVANEVSVPVATLADPFINEPMQTLAGIMLKAALNDVGEWWGESALADVSRLAADHFRLPAPALYHQELSPAEGSEDEGA